MMDAVRYERQAVAQPAGNGGFYRGILGSNPAPPSFHSIGAPLLAATGYGYDAALWLLSDGQAIVKIGCQTRLLTDWEHNAESYVRQLAGDEPKSLRILLSFLSLCRTAMESEQGAP